LLLDHPVENEIVFVSHAIEEILEKLGYKAKKGHFTLFRKGHKGSRKMRGGTGAPMEMGMQGTPVGNAMAGIAKPMPVMGKGKMMGGRHSRKYMKGGMAYGGPLSPQTYDGRGVGTSGAGLQIMATTMS
jgi:hypothetical protein